MSDIKQDQRSQQSLANAPGTPSPESAADKGGKSGPAGIGASQGQDREKRRDDDVPHTGPGTADIERSSAGAQGSSDSLSDDPVGAYKERP